MKLIDKDALVAEIGKWIELLTNEKNKKDSSQIVKLSLGGRIAELQEVKVFLDTLEVKEVGVDFGDPKGDKSAKCIIDTKALEVKEVNLKEEIDKIWKPRFSLGWDDKSLLSVSYKGFEVIARHFFELGLNAQRKISYVPNIDDSLEELGVDPTSKEAKIFKESYYIALEKLKAQKGEKV